MSGWILNIPLKFKIWEKIQEKFVSYHKKELLANSFSQRKLLAL